MIISSRTLNYLYFFKINKVYLIEPPFPVTSTDVTKSQPLSPNSFSFFAIYSAFILVLKNPPLSTFNTL